MKEFMNRGIERRALADYKREMNLLNAAETGDLKACVALLKDNPKEAWKTDEISYFTPLHLAANLGHLDVCRTILDYEPAIINRKSKSGETALHLACVKGHEEIVKLLLMRDADTTLTNFHKAGTYTERNTAREVAEKYQHSNLLKIFDNWEKYKVKRDKERQELVEFTAMQETEKKTFLEQQKQARITYKANHEGSEVNKFLQDQEAALQEKSHEMKEMLIAFYSSHKTLKLPVELTSPETSESAPPSSQYYGLKPTQITNK